jgi:hypothetical protein
MAGLAGMGIRPLALAGRRLDPGSSTDCDRPRQTITTDLEMTAGVPVACPMARSEPVCSRVPTQLTGHVRRRTGVFLNAIQQESAATPASQVAATPRCEQQGALKTISARVRSGDGEEGKDAEVKAARAGFSRTERAMPDYGVHARHSAGR